MATIIQWRRDTAANWTSVNPILANGEAGYETDTEKLKLGDGVTVWTLLPYWSGGVSGGIVESVVGGTDITVDAADPANPIVNFSGIIPPGGGQVDSVVGGTDITVDSSDPENPIVNNDAPDQIVSLTGGGITEVTGVYPDFTITSIEVPFDPAEFGGAGTTGYVPDPITEQGHVLSDSGEWVEQAGGGVEQLVAGANITLNPPDGLGVVTISSTGGSGGDYSIDGGFPDSIYTPPQSIDGGTP